MYTIFTISVYIRNFIEPKYNIPKWETEINALRAHLRMTKPFEPLSWINPIISLDQYHYARAIIWMGAICIGLCILNAYYWSLPVYEIIVAVTVACIASVFWAITCARLLQPIKFINSGEFESKLEISWTGIKGASMN
jgi:hypothetical protein